MRERQHDIREEEEIIATPCSNRVREKSKKPEISRDTKKMRIMIIDKVDEEADIGSSHAQRQQSTDKSKSVHGGRGIFHKQKSCALLHDQLLHES
jgi:hypothetical protein